MPVILQQQMPLAYSQCAYYDEHSGKSQRMNENSSYYHCHIDSSEKRALY